MQADSVIFDLDGTLWDSVSGILLTWNRVIARYPGLRAPIERPEQESVMGLQMDEIARRLFPGQTVERQKALMEACMEEENNYLRTHGGKLFPDLEQGLEKLHRRFPLFIVSNCQSGYIEAFLHAHELGHCFDGFSCFGDNGLSKGENIRRLADRYQLKCPVYVGDTQGDRDSAEYAGIPFVYAKYGFGTVTDYDAVIQTFYELTDILERC